MEIKRPSSIRGFNHISFDENVGTFRLYAGNSLYAFCISPELTLEHLYWGKKLRDGYDLRYINQSCRLTHFTTIEAAPHSFDGKIVIEAETWEEVQKTWKENKRWSSKSKDDADFVQRKRLENYSWRIMSKFSLATEGSKDSDRKKSMSVSFDMEDDMDTHDKAASTRHRSLSNPAMKVASFSGLSNLRYDPKCSLLDLNSMSKLVDLKETSPSRQFLESIVGGSGIKRHKNLQTFERQLGKIGKGNLCCEYSDHGTGDFRTPSFLVVDNCNGSTISPLKYRHHKIHSGKLSMPDNMPSIRCLNEDEATTLVVTLGDVGTGIEVDLIYVAMHNYDVITRRAVFRNVDKRCMDPAGNGKINKNNLEGFSKVIQKASSLTVDFESASTPFYLVQLSGSWARERYVVETMLNHGTNSFGSMRGVSGHAHNPFAAVTLGVPSEDYGEVKGFALVYSGNFLAEAEVNETGRLRFNLGIHPMGLQWYLKPKGVFSTPEAVLVRSGEGLGGMSRTMHRLILDRLIPRHWSDVSPPILLNSWEAKYFHVNHNNILEMAKQATKVGIDMIVLDDGWFGKRNNDHSSLGDWIPDLEKFPRGMKGIADDVNAAGCKFGLWLEPEMVSEESALFQSHPDWYLHVPGRPRQIGRNQMVLDFSRQDVREYLFNQLSSILSNANIEYVKWDMNRPLTEVYSAAAADRNDDVWQSEVSHRYVLGLYDFQNRFVTAFPHILFENCASGGGRFDLGMLYYSPQIWCSDNTDALVRMKIQYGSSLAYPARTIGAHVSTVPNHLTGNFSRLRTRGFVAMCGTFGYELDVSTSTPNDLLMFQKQVNFYKQIAPVVRWGDLYRLWNPFKSPLAAWMYVSRDKSQAVVFVFSLNSDHWNNLVPRLYLQGLKETAEYEVTEPFPNDITQSTGNFMVIETDVPIYQLDDPSVILSGDILMNAGLPVKFYSLDDSIVFVLKQVNDSHRFEVDL